MLWPVYMTVHPLDSDKYVIIVIKYVISYKRSWNKAVEHMLHWLRIYWLKIGAFYSQFNSVGKGTSLWSVLSTLLEAEIQDGLVVGELVWNLEDPGLNPFNYETSWMTLD